jgi:hypothetical protein
VRNFGPAYDVKVKGGGAHPIWESSGHHLFPTAYPLATRCRATPALAKLYVRSVIRRVVAGPDAYALQVSRRGARSCYPGKRIVAGLDRAMMFIVLWLTEAHRYYFRSCVW